MRPAAFMRRQRPDVFADRSIMTTWRNLTKGTVKDYTKIARLSQMTRARVTQIMYLKYLAPDLQEQLVELPMQHGKDPMSEKELRRIAMIPDWTKQRWFCVQIFTVRHYC